MSSPFDALDAAISRAVMDRFGETEAADLRPRAASQYAERAADPARPATTIRGIFSAGSGEGPIRGNNSGEFAGTTRLASMTVELWLPAAEVAAIPYKIAAGDLIEFSDRAGAPVYSVSRVQNTDLGDVNLILSREDQPE